MWTRGADVTHTLEIKAGAAIVRPAPNFDLRTGTIRGTSKIENGAPPVEFARLCERGREGRGDLQLQRPVDSRGRLCN